MEKRQDLVAPKEQSNAPVETTFESPYIHAATSDNTRLAYQADIQHFLKSGGRLPATPQDLERYLKDSAPQYNPRTLTRRITALRQWHRLKGVNDPTQDPRVKKTLRGIARMHGRPRQQTPALRLQDLDQILQYVSQQGTPQAPIVTIRNMACLLIAAPSCERRIGTPKQFSHLRLGASVKQPKRLNSCSHSVDD